MPAHITPARLKRAKDYWRGKKKSKARSGRRRWRGKPGDVMQRTFNRSGIRPLHQNCSFDNYRVECDGQMNALSKEARQYVDRFDGNIASFVFPASREPVKIISPRPD